MKTRMNLFLEESLKERLYTKAKELGMQPGVLASLAIRAGLDAVTMATDPNWKKYFEKMSEGEEPKK